MAIDERQERMVRERREHRFDVRAPLVMRPLIGDAPSFGISVADLGEIVEREELGIRFLRPCPVHG